MQVYLERLNGEFVTTVQQRGDAIIKARKLSSALSAASAACDHIRDWVLGTPEVSLVLFNRTLITYSVTLVLFIYNYILINVSTFLFFFHAISGNLGIYGCILRWLLQCTSWANLFLPCYLSQWGVDNSSR